MSLPRRIGFDGAFAWIVLVEGGYVNDPRDPGGETKYGISKRSYPHLDIKTLTVDAAREIYRTDFWNRAHCQEMPSSWALAVFDAAVHHGPRMAVQLLQRALGVTVDGAVGPMTLNQVRAASLEAYLPSFLSCRLVYMAQLRGASETYLRGWANRLFRLQQECLRVAVNP